MDQAALLSLLGSLYDKLVADVAERVKQTLPEPEVDLDKLRELVGPIVEARIEDAVEEAIQEHLTNYDHDEFQTENDVEAKMENWDLEDQVTDAVRNLRFTVRVD